MLFFPQSHGPLALLSVLFVAFVPFVQSVRFFLFSFSFFPSLSSLHLRLMFHAPLLFHKRLLPVHSVMQCNLFNR